MPRYIHTIVALLLLIWTNCLILFGLNISPRKEAALETIVNTVAMVGFLAYGIVHTWVINRRHPVPPLPPGPVEPPPVK